MAIRPFKAVDATAAVVVHAVKALAAVEAPLIQFCHFSKLIFRENNSYLLLWPRRQLAVVVLELAPLPVVVWHAVALVGVVDDEAEGVVLARVGVAPLQLDITGVAGEAERAGAGEAAAVGGVHAHAAVGAGSGQALIHVLLAVRAGPAGGAVAAERGAEAVHAAAAVLEKREDTNINI